MSASLFHPSVLARTDALRARFQEAEPLPGFLVLEQLLEPGVVATLRAACLEQEYATWCVGAPEGRPQELRSGFGEPDEEHLYVTVHQRAVKPSPALLAVRERMGSPEVLETLRQLTGLELSRLGLPDVLSCWDAYSFIEPHTDVAVPGHPPRLVISLSLTEGWRPAFGGRTTFAWANSARAVTLEPRLNQAVLFTPFDGSLHWVEQVSAEAPSRTRFTWTLHYF